jgi:hypothetical protein
MTDTQRDAAGDVAIARVVAAIRNILVKLRFGKSVVVNLIAASPTLLVPAIPQKAGQRLTTSIRIQSVA